MELQISKTQHGFKIEGPIGPLYEWVTDTPELQLLVSGQLIETLNHQFGIGGWAAKWVDETTGALVTITSTTPAPTRPPETGGE